MRNTTRIQELQAAVHRAERDRSASKDVLEAHVADLTLQLHASEMKLQSKLSAAESDKTAALETAAAATAQLAALQTAVQDERERSKLQLREYELRVERLESQRQAEVSAARRESDERSRRLDDEIRSVRESLWSREEEMRALRDKSESLKLQLDERREDLKSLKLQLVASGEREKELQRRLLQEQLRNEQRLQEMGAREETAGEATVQLMTAQRDHFAARAADLEAQVSAKDAELTQLRDEMSRKARDLQLLKLQLNGHAGGGTAAADDSVPQLQPPQSAIFSRRERAGAPPSHLRESVRGSLASATELMLPPPTPSSLFSTPDLRFSGMAATGGANGLWAALESPVAPSTTSNHGQGMGSTHMQGGAHDPSNPLVLENQGLRCDIFFGSS